MDKKVYCTFLGHSGFLLEFPDAYLLFDWAEGQLPAIDNNKTLYILISHLHSDHVCGKVFELAQSHPKCTVFVGHDDMSYFDSFSETIKNRLILLDGNQAYGSEDGKIGIQTLPSTDLGVAYSVLIDGMRIFHSGDLSIWRSSDSKELFEQYIKPIAGQEFDYGMLVMESRFGPVGKDTVLDYLKNTRFRLWSPMHLWGNYAYADSFIEQYPSLSANMIAVTANDAVHQSITAGERFYLFDIDEARVQAQVSEIKKLRDEYLIQAKADIDIESLAVQAGNEAIAQYINSKADPSIIPAKDGISQIRSSINRYAKEVNEDDVIGIIINNQLFSRTPKTVLFTKNSIISEYFEDLSQLDYNRISEVEESRHGISFQLKYGRRITADFKKANHSVYLALKAMLNAQKKKRLSVI